MEALNGIRRPDQTSQIFNKTLSPPPTGTQRSFAERKAHISRPTPLKIIEGNDNMCDIDRLPPGHVSAKKVSQGKPELTKQRSHYFEDAFAVKEVNPAKDRVLSESIVMADVKTNVIINDEFTFITELSYLLSTRYQRPISSIVVTLQHGTCMVFGGTFDPAYVLSIFALPIQLQPTTNKRNAALIQKHLEEVLGVRPSRGFLRFIPTLEDNTARNGKTLAGEIDEVGKASAAEAAEEFASVQRIRPKPKSRLSVRSFGTFRSSSATMAPTQELMPPVSTRGPEEPGDPGANTSASFRADIPTPPVKTAKRSKSFVANFFGRS
ncbi:Tautomerase/MIF [Coniochaeta sp. PMI_546]|nr:Tautomerase/MIF [Coniochaeta sp. PMI_546]